MTRPKINAPEKKKKKTVLTPVAKLVTVGDVVEHKGVPCKVIHINTSKQRFSLQPQPMPVPEK